MYCVDGITRVFDAWGNIPRACVLTRVLLITYHVSRANMAERYCLVLHHGCGIYLFYDHNLETHNKASLASSSYLYSTV